MNIFALDQDPSMAAEMHCDKHVVKMILESVQMLSTICEAGYKPTHKNHPCTIWARTSWQNFNWLCELTEALHAEWQYRFGHTHNHKSFEVYAGLPKADLLGSLPDIGLTPFAMAMPDYIVVRNADPVEAYRDYYKTEKAHLLTFTKREDWTK